MCPKDRNSPSGASYLLMLRDYVIMQDISDVIQEFDTNAQVITAPNFDDAVAAMERMGNLAIAFVEASPKVFSNSPLFAAIKARQGRVIYFGSEAEDIAETGGWAVLRRPFSSDIVSRFLVSAPMI